MINSRYVFHYEKKLRLFFFQLRLTFIRNGWFNEERSKSKKHWIFAERGMVKRTINQCTYHQKYFFFPIFRLKHSMNRIQNHCPLLSVKSNKLLKVNSFSIRQCLAFSLKAPLDFSYHHAKSLWNFEIFTHWLRKNKKGWIGCAD